MTEVRVMLGKRRQLHTWFGWPVRVPAVRASREQIVMLVKTANERGFSRKATGLDVDSFSTFVLVPYLPEGSPIPSHMCVVVAIKGDLSTDLGERPECGYARLDVAVGDFARLPRVRSRDRSQLVLWLAWEACGATRRQ